MSDRWEDFRIKGDEESRDAILKLVEELENKSTVTPDEANKYLNRLEGQQRAIDIALGGAEANWNEAKEELNNEIGKEHIKKLIDEDKNFSFVIQKYNEALNRLKEFNGWLILAGRLYSSAMMPFGRACSESRAYEIQSEVLKRLEKVQEENSKLNQRQLEQLGETLKNVMMNQQDKFTNSLDYTTRIFASKQKESYQFMEKMLQSSLTMLETLSRTGNQQFSREIEKQKETLEDEKKKWQDKRKKEEDSEDIIAELEKSTQYNFDKENNQKPDEKEEKQDSQTEEVKSRTENFFRKIESEQSEEEDSSGED